MKTLELEALLGREIKVHCHLFFKGAAENDKSWCGKIPRREQASHGPAWIKTDTLIGKFCPYCGGELCQDCIRNRP